MSTGEIALLARATKSRWPDIERLKEHRRKFVRILPPEEKTRLLERRRGTRVTTFRSLFASRSRPACESATTNELYETFAEHAAWIKRRLGPAKPDWYVFPKSSRTAPVDPTKPIGAIKSAWESMRAEAGLNGFRFHDFRHTAITNLIEAGTHYLVIMSIVGHVDVKMLEYYAHVGMEAKRRAVANLSLPASVETRYGNAKARFAILLGLLF